MLRGAAAKGVHASALVVKQGSVVEAASASVEGSLERPYMLSVNVVGGVDRGATWKFLKTAGSCQALSRRDIQRFICGVGVVWLHSV